MFQDSDWEFLTMVNLRDMMVMTSRLAAMIRIREMEMVMLTVCVSPG